MWIRAISGYLTTVTKRRFNTGYLHWFKNTLKEKTFGLFPILWDERTVDSVIEGDIRFSYEELVKVISITDYLVAKLRARAITRRTDEQCTTISPYADWIISCPWGISEQTEARKLVSKAPLTTLSKQLFHKRKKSSTLSFSRSRWSRIQISLPIIVQQFSLIEFRESGFNQVIFFILLLTCILENVYVVIFWGKIPIRSFLGI